MYLLFQTTDNNLAASQTWQNHSVLPPITTDPGSAHQKQSDVTNNNKPPLPPISTSADKKHQKEPSPSRTL